MRSILTLFGKSPFGPLQGHMRKVSECISEVPLLFDALFAGDAEGIQRQSQRLQELENEADEIKNEIRANLPKTFFLPVDRGDLLIMLHNQDQMADSCEDLGILLTMRSLDVPNALKDPLHDVLDKSLATGRMAIRLIDELDELVQASFGGVEAARVSELINDLNQAEHLCDRSQWAYARQVFSVEKELTAGELWMFLKLGSTLGNLANDAENVGKRLQVMLHV